MCVYYDFYRINNYYSMVCLCVFTVINRYEIHNTYGTKKKFPCYSHNNLCKFCFTLTGCCIYEKPHKFDEDSGTESDDEDCEHCFGHVEMKKKKMDKKKTNGTVTVTFLLYSDSATPI